MWKSDNNSPERGRQDERSTGNTVCKFKLRQRCLFSNPILGKVCHDVHLDDNSLGHDDEDDDDDRRSSRGQREWRAARPPRNEPMGNKRTSRDDRSSSNDRSLSLESMWSHEGSWSHERTRLVENRTCDDRMRYNKKESVEICRLFEMGLCSRGKSCPDIHPGEGDTEDYERNVQDINCKYFVRGLCNRGDKCQYAHPKSDLRSLVRKQVWLKLCKRYRLQMCEDIDCSYLHISIEDEALYKTSGLISENVLGLAMRKALRANIPLKNKKPVCKEKLDGECTIVGCPFLHISREEFIEAVLSETKSEFEKMYGPNECRFHSVEAQQTIVQKYLSPSIPKVSSAPLSVPDVPVVTHSSQMMTTRRPPSPIMAPSSGVQPKVTQDVFTGLKDKLRHDNEQLTRENESYQNYIRILKEENNEIMMALDPNQPAMDLSDIERRMLAVSEAWNWKSSLRLMEKTTDYQHSAPIEETPKYQSSNDCPENATPSIVIPPIKLKPPMRAMPPVRHKPQPQNISDSWNNPGLHQGDKKDKMSLLQALSAHTQTGPMVSSNIPSQTPGYSIKPNQPSQTPKDAKTDKTFAKFLKQYERNQPGAAYTISLIEVDTPTQTPKNRKKKGGTTTIVQSENEKTFEKFLKQVKARANQVLTDKRKKDNEEKRKQERELKMLKEQKREQDNKEKQLRLVKEQQERQQRIAADLAKEDAKQKSYLKWVLDQHIQKVGRVAESDDEDDVIDEDGPKQKRKRRRMEDPFDPRKIDIRNFSSVHNKSSLKEYFGQFGKIIRIRKRLCYGYVLFEDESTVEKVLAHGGPHIVNRFEVHVRGPMKRPEEQGEKEQTNMEDAEEGEDEGGKPKKDVKEYGKVVLDGFTEEHKEESLEEYFSAFGKLSRMVLRPTYGFFVFEDHAIAQKVRQQTEHVINGVPVYVRPLDDIREMKTKDDGKILIEDLTFEHSLDTLVQYFRKLGRITFTEHLGSHAYITFADPSIAKQLIEKNEPLLICSGEVTVKPPGVFGTNKDESKVYDGGKIMVNGLTEVHNSDNIQEYFRAFGKLNKMLIKSTHAVIIFEDPAIALQVRQQTEPHVINDVTVCIRQGSEIREMNTSNVGKILVDGLRQHSRRSLLEYFGRYGTIAWIKHHMYHAYVIFADPSIAQQVLEKDELPVINGLKVFVRPPDAEPGKVTNDDDSVKQPVEAEGNNIIKEKPVIQFDPPDAFYQVYVGSLDKTFSDDVIKEYFSQFGEVHKIEVKRDKKERSRGFGFVSFYDYEVAKALVSRDDHVMGGVPIVVQRSSHKVKKPVKRIEPSAEKRKLPSDDEESEGSKAKRRATQFALAEEMAEELDLMHAKELGLMEELDEYENVNYNKDEDSNSNEYESSSMNEQEDFNSNKYEASSINEQEDINSDKYDDSNSNEHKFSSVNEHEDSHLDECGDSNVGVEEDSYSNE